MAMKRIRMALSDTGTTGDTGYLDGELLQVRWYPAGGTDTGGSMIITLYPSSGDTGHGFIIWNDTGKLRTQWTAHPRATANETGGSAIPATGDTGTAVPWVGAGDKLHVQIASKKALSTLSGTVYLYYRQ